MDKSFLVKIIGFPATLIHGSPSTLDRWFWLLKRLPATNNGEKLIDIGCGTGAFCIGASLRGYHTLGLSWDKRNQEVASERAELCKAHTAKFEILDVRELHIRDDLFSNFDVAICCENIEHIIDDRKLLKDIAYCLKPGGRLLLTTPYFLYRPITKGDKGPFSITEDGGHVRRGYTVTMLEELCKEAEIIPEKISYCSGLFSQKINWFQRSLSRVNPFLGWLVILPMRILPPLFDWWITDLIKYPYFSICLEAYKPRFKKNNSI
jgi:SAM-dependent methyltransferase